MTAAASRSAVWRRKRRKREEKQRGRDEEWQGCERWKVESGGCRVREKGSCIRQGASADVKQRARIAK